MLGLGSLRANVWNESCKSEGINKHCDGSRTIAVPLSLKRPARNKEVSMAEIAKQDWRDLCKEASQEEDGEKLLELVKQINVLLSPPEKMSVRVSVNLRT
jgi:hypothetical protein